MSSLREIAEAANHVETYQGPWSWVDRPIPDDPHRRNELLVGSGSEMGHVADVVPWMPELAAHIATFSPSTVLALLDVVDAARPFALYYPNLAEALARLPEEVRRG